MASRRWVTMPVPGCVLMVLVCAVLQLTVAYRILGINISPSRSHVIVQDALMKELARRGHHVTMVSPYSESEQVPNYRKITIPMDSWGKDFSKNILSNSNSRMAMFRMMPQMLELSASGVNRTIRSPEVQAVLQEKEGYDVLITGAMGDAVLGLTHALGVPSVIVWPNTAVSVVNSMVGNPQPLATVPNMLLGLSHPMSFGARLANAVGCLFDEAFAYIWAHYQRQVYNELFPADRFPSYDAVRRNVSLVLLNHHVSKSSPRPYVPMMVEVGGLQIRERPAPLPDDVRQWIEGADHGVILFSLGTNLLSSSIERQKLDALLAAFGKLPQRVIWKWDTPDMPNRPANVLLKQWLPQDDILAHPNVRLFIMHGGLGGIAEAQYHGVPLVGIPMFGDQPINLARVEAEGWVYVLQYADLDEPRLTAAIGEVLHNPRYRENVQRLSRLYRDRPATAMDTAVYWTEYVIRHRGAHHLRYPGVDMPFWQLHSLDVIAFFAGAAYALAKIITFSCRACRRNRAAKLKRQ